MFKWLKRPFQFSISTSNFKRFDSPASEALHLAHDSEASPEAVTARATAYFKFLMGD